MKLDRSRVSFHLLPLPDGVKGTRAVCFLGDDPTGAYAKSTSKTFLCTGNLNFELPRPTAGWARPAARDRPGGRRARPCAARRNSDNPPSLARERHQPVVAELVAVKPGEPCRKTPTGEELTKLPLHELGQALALTQRRRLRSKRREVIANDLMKRALRAIAYRVLQPPMAPP
jgi:hypothetical protein